MPDRFHLGVRFKTLIRYFQFLSHERSPHSSMQGLRERDPSLLLRKTLIPLLVAETFSTS